MKLSEHNNIRLTLKKHDIVRKLIYILEWQYQVNVFFNEEKSVKMIEQFT